MVVWLKSNEIGLHAGRANIILLALAVLCCGVCSRQASYPYQFLNQTHQPYCKDRVLSESEWQQEMLLRERRWAQLRQWVPLLAEHMIEAIVLLCNNKPADVINIIHGFVKYSLIYSSPFLVSLALLVVLGAAWAYLVLWKEKDSSSGNGGAYLGSRSKVPLAVLLFSLLLAVSISLYGIWGSVRIEKTLNRLWCQVVKQENGYLKEAGGARGNMIDFAAEISDFQAFLNQRHAAIIAQMQQLQKENIVGSSFSFNSSFFALANTQYGFSQVESKSAEISRIMEAMMVGQQSAMQYYNSTLEYERQVLIGMTFVKGNIDRYGARLIGFDNVSKVFSGAAQFLLVCTIVVCVCSLVGMAMLLAKEKPIYYKYMAQYALGVVCLCCLVSAVLNSFMTIFLNLLNDLGPFILAPGRPRSVFLSTGTLNDPLVEIMASFWPQASGRMSDYGNSTLLLSLSRLEQQIEEFNELSLWEDREARFSKSIVDGLQAYKKSLGVVKGEAAAVREKMVGNDGLGKLDPRAFGRNIFDVATTAATSLFNRTYQYRTIFGLLSLSLLTALLSTIFITPPASTTYVKASQIDLQSSETMIAKGQSEEETAMLDH